ncbi:N-acetylglucosamine-6-phosphate deacetylase [Bacillus sp. JJ1562]|uniref:N-acetylglucosamine-6-phosphate deacetylase n=1 Tax=Bacillus sp. JJ1562 TaxID=3122960 RepID=UPI003002D2C8
MQNWIGKHWITGETLKVQIKDRRIQSITKTTEETEGWIAPGLIDIQVNGIGGFDINGTDTTVETIKNVVKVLHEGGVTRFCPTVVTGTKERILHCVRTIAKACMEDSVVNHAVIGIHVEGPFISAEDGPRGAHNLNWVRDPDWDEFLEWQEAADNRICKVTLAPEKPGAIKFIENLYKAGVVAAIGHSNSTEEDIQNAVYAGATMSTHLGNGAHPYIKRHPNYIWAQLADDRLWAGLIPDGHHLPYSTLKVMVRAKGNKAILTSDAVNLAGLPPGRYRTHINDDVVLEEDGFLHLANTPDILAGSATPLHLGIRKVLKDKVFSLEEAIKMATLHPANLFGLSDKKVGTLEVGSPADFIFFNWDENEREFSILKTISNGSIVYESK